MIGKFAIYRHLNKWNFRLTCYLQESETQTGSKSMPGRGVTLQMLLEEKMLEPGIAAMTIEYLVCIFKYVTYKVQQTDKRKLHMQSSSLRNRYAY